MILSFTVILCSTAKTVVDAAATTSAIASVSSVRNEPIIPSVMEKPAASASTASCLILPDQTTIHADTVWSSERVYVLDGKVTIAKGSTLTIRPGTIIKGVDQGSRLIINGTLLARGSEQAPIIFTSLRDDRWGGDTNGDSSGSSASGSKSSSPASGDWDGLFFSASSASASLLDHCLISYGGSGSQMSAIFCNQASPTITHCTISHSRACGLRLQDASPTISHCTISHSSSAGILCEGASCPTIKRCTIHHNRTYGIYSLGTSTPVITENTFSDNGLFAAFLSCTGKVFISDNTIRDCGGGICLAGVITADTHLNNSPDCPYMLNGLTVAEGATLSIEPGIIIKGKNQCTWLIVNGTTPLISEGSLSSAAAGEDKGRASKELDSLPKLRLR
ncbi:MAG: right-handed parallel beta-helix repeat-containing protein [bacterium]|nr:right-handed parallel beta-helix repeat-containing protein [bacterium]